MNLYKKIENPSATNIIELLKQKPSIVEEGMIIIDSGIIIPEVCEIDLIGLSAKNVSFICVIPSLTKDYMEKSIAIKRWIDENFLVLKQEHTLHGFKIPNKSSIIFLCSYIDRLAFRAMSLFNNLPLKVLRYRCDELECQKWFTLEKIISEEDLEYEVSLPRRVCDDEKPRKTLEKFKVAALTEAEINEFFATGS